MSDEFYDDEVEVIAIRCPSCGGEDDISIRLKTASLRKPWYCARCLGVWEAARLRGTEHGEYDAYRLLFAVRA